MVLLLRFFPPCLLLYFCYLLTWGNGGEAFSVSLASCVSLQSESVYYTQVKGVGAKISCFLRQDRALAVSAGHTGPHKSINGVLI